MTLTRKQRGKETRLMQPTKYPGLREKIASKFKDHPTHQFAVADLRRSFTGVSPNTLRYHVVQMQHQGILECPKGGFWRLSTEKPKSPERIRSEIAAQPSRVVQSAEPFTYGKENGITPVDTMWQKLLTNQLESVLARMDSGLPAKELFTVPDRTALQELLALAISGRAMLPRTIKA